MKKKMLLLLLALFLLLLAVCLLLFARTPGTQVPVGRTVTVKVANAGEPRVYCADMSKLVGADVIITPKEEKEDGSTVFSLPDDSLTYHVWVRFMGNNGEFQSFSYPSLPGENLVITGTMHDDYFDCQIKGAPMLEALCAYKNANNFLCEQELGALGFSYCGPERPTEQMEELQAKRKNLMRDYIMANPDNDLSAFFVVNALNMDLYEGLTDKVKNGPYKVMLDYYNDMYLGNIEVVRCE